MSRPTVVDFQSLDEKVRPVVEGEAVFKDPNIQNLIFEAIEARKLAYVPYSNFPVGACLEVEDTCPCTIYRGCNVENAVYPLCICAERTAVVKAVSSGHKNFKSIAVIGDQDHEFTTPCGSCRQVLAEFNREMIVYMTRPTLGKVLVMTVDELLPISFHF